MHTHRYLCILIGTSTYLKILIHTCKYVYIPINTYTYFWILMHTHRYLCILIDASTYLHILIYTCRYLYVHICLYNLCILIDISANVYLYKQVISIVSCRNISVWISGEDTTCPIGFQPSTAKLLW